MDVVNAKIRTFLTRAHRNADLQDEDDVFAKGYITSLFAMQLVMFVEREFSITIGNEDLDLANFSTIGAITRLVERKRAHLAVQAPLSAGSGV